MSDLAAIELERALCRAFLKWAESEVVIYRSIQVELKAAQRVIPHVAPIDRAAERKKKFEEKDRKAANRQKSRYRLYN